MGALLDDLARRGVEPDDVAAELDFVWWTSLSEDLTVRDPRYGAHDGAQLQRVAREYVAADHAHLRVSADRVRAGAGRRLREVLADHPDQEALVRAEAGKARRHRPLRELLPKAAETLTAAKPAWAMSPLVVASVLPPGRWFDVVIFDEASQIPPAQAVSAISRAHQVVVAGDERQLPPTSFFTAAVDEDAAPESDALTEGFESVLDVLTAALPTRRLSWHYRSLDERLVAFANQEMYDGSLVTFPGTGTDAVVRLESVEGSGVVTPGEEAIESTEAEVVAGRRARPRARPHPARTSRSASSRSASSTRPGSTTRCAGPSPPMRPPGWATSSTRTGPSGSSSRTSNASRVTSATRSSCRSATARPRTVGCCTGSVRSTSRAANVASTSPSPAPVGG